jgi:hypothetical protein
VLETSGMIADQQFSILIDLGAIGSFLSSVSLKIIKVKVVEHDEFRYVEMASRAKKKVGGKVKDCNINLGDFITSVNLYVTILGDYDIVIGIDWLELHDTILNYKMKQLSLINDLGQSRKACTKDVSCMLF